MPESGLFYCGIGSLIYVRERSALPGSLPRFEFLKVLDCEGGLEAFRSGHTATSSGVERCFAELYQIFDIAVEEYITQNARTKGVLLEEDDERSWFCYFEAPMAAYPSLTVAIFDREALVYGQRGREWIHDRCYLGILPTPIVLFA